MAYKGKAKRANGEGSVYEIAKGDKKVIEAQLTRIIYVNGEKQKRDLV